MTSFDPETRAALRLVAQARTPDAAAVERAWAAMQVRLVDGPPPMDLGLDDAAPRGIRPLVLATAAAALVVLAVGVTHLAGEWARSDDRGDDGLTSYEQKPTAEEELTVSPPAADTSAQRIVESPLPAASTEIEATPSTESAQTIPVPRRSKPTTVTEPAKPSNSDLEAELRLLAQANAAAREGRNADALRELDQHMREFPRGQLAPERDYKRAKVTCELGQDEAARKLAQKFLRTYPRSPMRAKAGEICKEPAE